LYQIGGNMVFRRAHFRDKGEKATGINMEVKMAG